MTLKHCGLRGNWRSLHGRKPEQGTGRDDDRDKIFFHQNILCYRSPFLSGLMLGREGGGSMEVDVSFCKMCIGTDIPARLRGSEKAA